MEQARRENQISHQSEYLENVAIVVTATDCPEVESLAGPDIEENSSHRRLGQRATELLRIRFSLENFRLGRGFTQRSFNITEASLLFILAYIASHGLGFVRQTMFNALFGVGPEANAYYAAFLLPDTLFNIIAGGSLVYAFIPVFISYEKEHSLVEVWRLASLLLNLVLVVLTILLLLGEFFAPTLVSRLLVPGYSPSQQALTVSLTRIMLLQPLLLGASTITNSILSSKCRFFLPALSIAVYNFGIIAGLLLTLAIRGVGIYGPTFGVVAAAVCMLLPQVFGVFKQGCRYTFTWDLRHPGLREVLRLLWPTILAVGISSIALIVDTAFTSRLFNKASLSAMHNALILFNFPLLLLAQAIAQAALPRMTILASTGHFARFGKLTLNVVGGAVLLSIPTALLLWLFGKPIIHILFQHGAFTSRSTNLTAMALIGYAVGLPGHIANELLGRSFYALKDALTPLFISVMALTGRIGLILLLFTALTGKFTILAIPLAGASIVTMQAGTAGLLLHFRLRKKIADERERSKL